MIFYSGPAIVVKVGMSNLQDIGFNIQIIEIAEIINHPKYKMSQKYDDIALYRLKQSIDFNANVRPACIQTTPIEWKKAIAIGFGKTDYGWVNIK